MKITLTGSIGHIGKPRKKTLVGQGYTVTLISSNPARKAAIRDLGATELKPSEFRGSFD